MVWYIYQDAHQIHLESFFKTLSPRDLQWGVDVYILKKFLTYDDMYPWGRTTDVIHRAQIMESNILDYLSAIGQSTLLL